jgi:predicted SAM-dependent methyltransferase
MAKKPLILNLGCGNNKIPGCVNIDAEASVNPDRIINFIAGKLPYKPGTVDEVYLFHTIEHISKKFHIKVFAEVYKALKPNGKFYLAYPEFRECYKRWENNYQGKKEFWEATMFGRQLYPTDFHVCAMDTTEVKLVLESVGFGTISSKPEYKPENHNTILCAIKNGVPDITYEDVIKQHQKSIVIRDDRFDLRAPKRK